MNKPNSIQQISRHQSRHSGFTMLELLITMAIIAILAGIAAPSYNGMIARNKVNSMRENLANALQYARSEAIKRKVDVIVCASADQSSCNGGTDWHQGWVIFADDNGDDSLQASERLQVQYSYSDLVTGSVGTARVGFAPSGRSSEGGNQTIGVCDPNDANNGKALRISATGSISRQGHANAGC